MHDLEACLARGFVGRQDEQILRLAVLQEVDVPDLFIVFVLHIVTQELKYMLPVVVPDDAVRLTIADDQALLLEFVAVSEAYESLLREAEVVDTSEVVFQLEGQMFTDILLLIEVIHVDVIDSRVLLLDHVGHIFDILQIRQGGR